MLDLKVDITKDSMFFADTHWWEVVEHAPLYEQLDVLPEYFCAPIFVLWEITGHCPCRCIYCYVGCPRPPKDTDLTSDQMMDVARQLVRCRVQSICLSGGEPTIHPSYRCLVEYFSENGIQLGTVTNGWGIDKSLASLVARKMSSVQVSLDGSSAEVHDQVRGRYGSFDKAVTAIRHLQEAGARNLCVAFAPTKINIDDFENVIRLCHQMRVKTLRTQQLAVVGSAADHLDCIPTRDQYDRLLSVIEAHRGSHSPTVEWGDPSLHMRVGLALGRVFGARITSSGDVGFTPYLEWYFGSVASRPFEDIWLGGLAWAWKHPLVRQQTAKVQGAQDLRVPEGRRVQYLGGESR